MMYSLQHHAEECRATLAKLKVRGPWSVEPNFADYTKLGFRAFILRNAGLLTLNGYLGIPDGHPWFGLSKEDCQDIKVHGGVSWARAYVPQINMHDSGLWFIGFDCSHFYERDCIPVMIGKRDDIFQVLHGVEENYRDFEFVKKQLASLASQARRSWKRTWGSKVA